MRLMRLILWICLVLGICWAGYWALGARQIRQGVTAWFAEQSAAGLVAENGGIAVAGFADRFDLTVTAPHLADPYSGWGWRAPFLQVFAMTWKPWQLIAALPQTQEIALPDGQRLTLDTQRLMASLLTRPSPSLPLRRAVIEGERLQFTSDRGWQAGAAKAVLAAAEDPSRINGLRLGAEISDLTPPASLTALPGLGPKISRLHLDASLGLALPVSLGQPLPEIAAISLSEASLTWGDLGLQARGEISEDDEGRALGQISVTVQNWRILPPLAVKLGMVPAENEETLTRALAFLARLSPDPQAVTLPMRFDRGQTWLGPLPIGPAPLLRLDQRQ